MSFSRKRCGTSMGNEEKKSDESSISSMENASKNIAQSLTSIVMASRDEVNSMLLLCLARAI